MDGLRRELGMSDELIKQAENDRINHAGVSMKIKINRTKKTPIESFVTLFFKPTDVEAKETIEQDFHY
jgi:hypothetical protein